MADNWIAGAIKNPGALKRAAMRAGAMTKGGTIKADFIAGKAKKGGVIGARARLAKTLKSFGKKAT